MQTDQGRFAVELESEYLRFFNAILNFLGGVSGQDTTAIKAIANEALARAFLAQQQPAPAVDTGQVLGMVRSFTRRAEAQMRPDDAQMVIAMRVFNR